ncbi:hypothetical protein N5J77_16510 [Sphingobium yanoikuyae]|uniref:Uncharacterized protein n=1 Tax=Sphingobium yanoikuyae TaxID=13690 RepID=A0AA42WW79_SPHYA|nr:hypothetical protein [Sphingobium yanoikuyae]MDH2132730.1 hypothetical protein [Sphingobium yanoikuyae]MDH2149397.1 hypothetical protein [Sphingobium yanoikuyae]MDH2168143.1 hypothetical protein [Sphingobium yanoikuyae]
MPTPGIHEEAGIASAHAGLIMLDGPNGIAITLTASAAEGTGLSLLRAAELAREQLEKGQTQDFAED